MRSAGLVLALLIGTAVAAAVTVDGKRLFTAGKVKSAPAITFLWTTRFPLGGQLLIDSELLLSSHMHLEVETGWFAQVAAAHIMLSQQTW